MELHEVKKPKLYSLYEVADFMGLSYITLYRLVRSGKIKTINRSKSGTRPIYGITPEALQEYYDQIPNTTKGSENINK